MSVKLNIFGDLCPIGWLDNEEYRNGAGWLGDLQKTVAGADFNIVNLECPLTESDGRILKSGPHLKADPKSTQLLTKSGINIVTLANNHIMDFGDQGLVDTLNLLEGSGIAHVGAGKDLQEARKPLMLEKNGVSIALINFCEREFSIASNDKPGAAPYDLVDNYFDIINVIDQVDHAIVIIHGGIENYPYPTPRQIKTYRFFASLGVSAIIGHHSHCVQPFEVYQGTPIYYSLGNFVFDEDGNPDTWYQGMGVSLTIAKGERCNAVSTEEIFFKQRKGSVIKIESEMKAGQGFNIDAIQQAWFAHVAELRSYRATINNIQKAGIIKRLYRRMSPRAVRKSMGIDSYNVLRNESHYEVLIGLIKQNGDNT